MKLLLPRWIEHSDRRGDAAGLPDAQQTANQVPQDDVTVTIPRATDCKRGQIAQCLRRTFGYIEFLELCVPLEGDEPAVGRPKRGRPRSGTGDFRTKKRPDVQSIHGSQPETDHSVRANPV